MKKRLWKRSGIGLIAIAFGLFVWVEANPASTMSGAVAWGLVLLAYVLAGLSWAAVGIGHVVLTRYFGPNRAADGPETDYSDFPVSPPPT
jgi:hypothetical protein